MVFSIGTAAQQEVSDAAQWYDQQQGGHGRKFMAAFRQACQRIRDNPLGGSILETQDDPNIRRMIIDRFPYIVIYDCQDLPAAVRIVAVSHMRRRPNYWQGRRRSS